jgi:hypothetical protein
MRKMPWVMYLWPGVPQLWMWGNWTGLVTAVIAAAILDLLLLGSFGWSELFTRSVRTEVWAIGAVAWIVAALWSAHRCRQEVAATSHEPGKDTFGEALSHYLKGDYFQAERLLEVLLRANVRDLDARLMLATLMRRTGRFDEAAKQLDTLVRFDGVAKWQLEIEHEREQLADAKTRKVVAIEPAEPIDHERRGSPAHAA